METQFQISKGSSSNTKSNGNSSLPILNQFECPTQTPRVCLNRVPLTGSIVQEGGGDHIKAGPTLPSVSKLPLFSILPHHILLCPFLSGPFLGHPTRDHTWNSKTCFMFLLLVLILIILIIIIIIITIIVICMFIFIFRTPPPPSPVHRKAPGLS